MNGELAEKALVEFISTAESYAHNAEQGLVGRRKELDAELRLQLPTIITIYNEVYSTGATWFPQRYTYASLWDPARHNALSALGAIRSASQREAILARPEPSGPQIAANALHPTVWSAAARLWDDGHYRAALQGAATAIDVALQAKLNRYDVNGYKLINEAFSPADPPAGKARLRFAEINPANEAAWKDMHVGAMNFGQGCMMAIRNLVTHSIDEPEAQVALEQLAALSVLARWIDEAEVSGRDLASQS